MTRRRFLTRKEVDSLMDASLHGRNGIRNYVLIFMAFRHGLRISELLSIKICDIDLMSKQIYVRRLKNGFSTIHPFDTKEFLLIEQWLNLRETYFCSNQSDLLFISEKNPHLSRKQAWAIIRECGKRAKLPIVTHPHMLRHACGYILANEGADTRLIQDYLGHKNIRHTVHYTKGNPERFSLFLQTELK